MADTQIIEQLIDEGNIQEAINSLDNSIKVNPNESTLYFLRGKAKWKIGDKAAAITDYEYAVSLDPNSPAKAALEISRNIMDFYNPDLLNP